MQHYRRQLIDHVEPSRDSVHEMNTNAIKSPSSSADLVPLRRSSSSAAYVPISCTCLCASAVFGGDESYLDSGINGLLVPPTTLAPITRIPEEQIHSPLQLSKVSPLPISQPRMIPRRKPIHASHLALTDVRYLQIYCPPCLVRS